MTNRNTQEASTIIHDALEREISASGDRRGWLSAHVEVGLANPTYAKIIANALQPQQALTL